MRRWVARLPVGYKKYIKNRGRFWWVPAACSGGRRTKQNHDLLQKAGDTHETHSNYSADAHTRCHMRLRTRDSVKMKFSGTSAASTINLNTAVPNYPLQITTKTISPGMVPWAHSPFVMYERSQLIRRRPALARAQIILLSRIWRARVYFASRTAVCCRSVSRKEAIASISRLWRPTAL